MKSQRTHLTLTLCALCLTASLTLTSCAAIERAAKDKALDAAGRGIAEQIADEKDRTAFEEKWASGDFSAALSEAGKSVADDKISTTLAEKLREADAANEELAARLERDGLKAVRQNWMGYLGAIFGMIMAAVGWKKNGTKAKMLRALFAAVGSFTRESGNGEGDRLLDKIEDRAAAASVKKPLDAMVARSGQKATRSTAGTGG